MIWRTTFLLSHGFAIFFDTKLALFVSMKGEDYEGVHVFEDQAWN
jgi:hypothetical protein